MERSVESRFFEKYTPEPNTGCWLWTASLLGRGYGQLWVNGTTALAHRISWKIHNGDISDGLCVLHKCDVPSCVNPDHLFLGTKTENAADRDAKKRQARGERSGQAKITKAEMMDIRSKYIPGVITQKELAEQYGIGKTSINNIVRHKTWKEDHG